MPMGVFQLVYISAAARPLDEAELADLLAAARVNNAANDITGMLVYHEGSFIQVLEGDEQLVEDTFERIQQDARHCDAHVLLRGQNPERNFGEWTMGFSRSAEDAEDLPGYSEFMTEGLQIQNPHLASLAQKALLSFRDGHWRQADSAP